MSRSANSRRGKKPQLRTRPVPYGEEQHRRVLAGQPTASAARRVQATEAHLDDTVRAPDGGHFCRHGCCGMIDARGSHVDIDVERDIALERAVTGVMACPGCGKEVYPWGGSWLFVLEVEDDASHDWAACWVGHHPHRPMSATLAERLPAERP